MSEIVWVYNPVARVLSGSTRKYTETTMGVYRSRYIDRVISTYKWLIYPALL